MENAVLVKRGKDDPYQKHFVELAYSLLYPYFYGQLVRKATKRSPLGWFGEEFKHHLVDWDTLCTLVPEGIRGEEDCLFQSKITEDVTEICL